jgi:MoxR-like ATPase
LILADEVNRAPAKVQSALLEAMAEQQISVGHQTYPLPTPFMVMATQNPIEQEGTYPLPEAQLDRFLMKVVIDYPDAEHEAGILRLVRAEALNVSAARVAGKPIDSNSASQFDGEKFALSDLYAARQEVLEVFMADDVEDYIVRLVTATRNPARHNEDIARWLEFGASPRGTLCLESCARAHAWVEGRDSVSRGAVQAIVHDVLRHRLLLTFEAEADGISADDAIAQLLRLIAVP